MQAVVLKEGERGQYVTVTDLPAPLLTGPGDVRIRALSVGLDGTDREIIRDRYGVLPEGASQLVIGHELLGVVVEAGPASMMKPGELATVLVRRPCGDARCTCCRSGQQDYCSTGFYTERGIRGADGFLCEYVVERSDYVVPVPRECAEYGVLVEPQSIVEKVWNQVGNLQRRLAWSPETVLIVGSGPLGLLAALTCRSMGLGVHVWSRSNADSVNADIVRSCGGRYHEVNLREEPSADSGLLSGGGGPSGVSGLAEFAVRERISPDLIWECSGYSPHAFDAMKALNPNGVLVLLGVASGDRRIEISSDMLNQEMVLKNKAIIGSVNASRADFESAIRRLQRIEAMYPGQLVRLMTERLSLGQVPDLDFEQITVKAVVDLVTREEAARLIGGGVRDGQ